MNFKKIVPGSATTAALLLHGLARVKGTRPGLVFLNPKEKPETDDGGRTLYPLQCGDWSQKGNQMKAMADTLNKAMDRMPPAFWDIVKIPHIYCVEEIRFEYAKELVVDAVFSRKDNSIAFRRGFEDTIFHELGHAMDNVRVSDDYDEKWDQFCKLVCSQVGQKHIPYLSTLNSSWTCKRDENGDFPSYMVIPEDKINIFFGDTISTHFDGCYAASAAYEDRQEIFRAMMEPDQRENYLFNDDGPQWIEEKSGSCKCTHCERPFADMENAGAGNRFAVLRAKSWWQYFTINQNDNVINEETRNTFWQLDGLYSGPHVLKEGMLFLDNVRLEELEKQDRRMLDLIVPEYGELKENIIYIEEGKDSQKLRDDLRKLRIFNIMEEDLGVPMQGGKKGYDNEEKIVHSPHTTPLSKDLPTPRTTPRSTPDNTPTNDGDEAHRFVEPKSAFRALSPTDLNQAMIKFPCDTAFYAQEVKIKQTFMEELKQNAQKRKRKDLNFKEELKRSVARKRKRKGLTSTEELRRNAAQKSNHKNVMGQLMAQMSS